MSSKKFNKAPEKEIQDKKLENKQLKDKELDKVSGGVGVVGPVGGGSIHKNRYAP